MRSGKVRGVSDRSDLRDEVVGIDARRQHGVGALGCVVHRRAHTVDPVETLLDTRRARGAGHPADLEVDLAGLGSLDRRHGWFDAAGTSS